MTDMTWEQPDAPHDDLDLLAYRLYDSANHKMPEPGSATQVIMDVFGLRLLDNHFDELYMIAANEVENLNEGHPNRRTRDVFTPTVEIAYRPETVTKKAVKKLENDINDGVIELGDLFSGVGGENDTNGYPTVVLTMELI